MATTRLPEPATQITLNADDLAITMDGAQVLAHLYGFDVGGDNWDRVQVTGGALDVNVTAVAGAVDTELPAAIAAAEDMANPTAPFVLSALMGYEGGTWDRLLSTAGVLRVDTELPDAAALDDDMANPTTPFVGSALAVYNALSGNWERAHTLSGTSAPAGSPIGHQVTGKTEGKVTYRLAFKDLAALGGLAVSLRGNAATTVRVTKVQVAKPSVAQEPLRLIKTSTAAHGGTYTTPTPIPLDSADGAAASLLRLYTVLPANGDVSIGQVWQVDASGAPDFVDETIDANDPGDNDWLLFLAGAGEEVGDYVAIGYVEQFGGVIFDNVNGVRGVDGVVVWEYWDGDSWEVLADVTDGTAGFTVVAADDQSLTFSIPADWAPQVLNESASLFYIRARITTVYSTNPVYDQGFILPASTEIGTGSIYEADIAVTEAISESFGDEQNAQAIVLRGLNETLEIDLSAAATLAGYMEWTEE